MIEWHWLSSASKLQSYCACTEQINSFVNYFKDKLSELQAPNAQENVYVLGTDGTNKDILIYYVIGVSYYI